MKIVAVVPAFNEAETVGYVVRETKKYVDEVIVVDDSSTDDTLNAAREQGAVVYGSARRMGLGATMRKAYEMALEHDADIIVQLDADGQYDPNQIPKLLELIVSNRADVVLGSRFMGGIEYMVPVKRFGNTFFSIVVSLLSGQRISDSQTGFRVTRRAVLEKVLPDEGYTYTQEMVVKTIKEGFRLTEVPVTFKRRRYAGSRLMGNPFTYGMNAGWIVFRLALKYHRNMLIAYTIVIVVVKLAFIYLFL